MISFSYWILATKDSFSALITAFLRSVSASYARDVAEMVDGIKRTREMAAQKPWDEFRSASLDADLEGASDADVARWLRNNANTEHHPAGTCRMGTDSMAVTDAQGRVHGMEGLRVIDGSIMPRVPTANIQAPIMMVAEKIVAGMAT